MSHDIGHTDPTLSQGLARATQDVQFATLHVNLQQIHGRHIPQQQMVQSFHPDLLHLAFALKTMTSHEGGFSRGGTPQMDLGVAHLRSKGDGLHQDLRLLRQVPCRMLGLLEGLHCSVQGDQRVLDRLEQRQLHIQQGTRLCTAQTPGSDAVKGEETAVSHVRTNLPNAHKGQVILLVGVHQLGRHLLLPHLAERGHEAGPKAERHPCGAVGITQAIVHGHRMQLQSWDAAHAPRTSPGMRTCPMEEGGIHL
mmetsp:Transcript_71317/g.157474  ORF Transcript_71317/g.157474 Transcript_71317/m.157474 type:complete len:252 (-) Transcript_71317:913-1668(-)